MLEILSFSVISVFGFMVFMFLLAMLKKDNGIMDIGWGIGFCIITATGFFKYSDATPTQQIVAALVFLWALRLSGYILIRNWGRDEDFRYKNWRNEWGKTFVWRSFLQVFMLQGLIMLIISLPIMRVLANPTSGISTWVWAGITLWLIGWLCEAIADFQMLKFKSAPANKGEIMETGLWRYSRHPNYFGEALLWWGIFFISVPAGSWYISVVSPLLLTFLLLKVSGVTMLEEKYDGNSKYDVYKRRTSAFIPLPRKR